MDNNNCNLNNINMKKVDEINDNLNNKEIDSEDNELDPLTLRYKEDNDLKNISKNKLDKIISLDTLVYEILGPGEIRIKNFEKISSEIKKVEQMAKIEKAKLKKKINLINKSLNNNENKPKIDEEREAVINDENTKNKLYNLHMKQLIMMEFERDKKYNFIEVVQKLKIPPEKRTIRDILRIKTYFDQSKLGMNFKDEFAEKKIVEKLIHFCCMEMRYQKFKKNETIIKIGSPPDFFYSIIIGKVKVIKPVPKIEELTGFQYFKYLMNLKRNNDDFVFKECIRNNKNNFHIELSDAEIIHYTYLLNYFEHIKANNEPTIEFNKVLDLLNIKPEELGIKPDSVNNNYYINDNLKKIIKKIPYVSPSTIEQYSFIFDNIAKKKVTIYEYKQFLSLKTNDYFGDSAIETNSPRNVTIIAEEDTDMAYLSNKLYSIQIASEKAILLQIRIKNLHQNFFFHRIQYYKFAKKYYTWFINEKYSKGDIIFNEGEHVKFLYFIQEGSVELSTSKSMNEIEELIKLINDKKEFLIRKNYTDIDLNILKKKYVDAQNRQNNLYEYNQINSSFNDIAEYINQKQNNKIIILNNNEDFGIISFFLGNEHLSTCTVASKYAKIHKIDTDYLNQMLDSEVEIKWDFYRRLKRKLELLSERLFKVNNIKLVMTDEKITKDKVDNKKIDDTEIIITNNSNSNIKASIKYDKINDLLNEQKYNSLIINNSNISTFNNIKPKLKNEINLPIINNNKNLNTFNVSLPLLNKENDELRQNHKTERVTKLTKKGFKFNNMKLFSILGQKEKEKQKKIFSKKLIIEESLLSRIQKDIMSFSQNKYTLSKDKKILNTSKNDLNNDNLNESKNKNKNNNQVYLTELSNNKTKHIKNHKYKEKSCTSSHILEKICDFSDRSISIDSPRNIKDKILKNNYRALFNNYKRNNKENNIINNSKSNDMLKGNKIKLNKKYNHPYYDPLTLIKKEKYKIFDNKDIIDNNKNNLIYHIGKIRELKQLRTLNKKSYKFNYKSINIKSKENN